jgi:hypothetical protein
MHMPPADYVLIAGLAAVIGCSLYFGPRIRADRVAMQWGVDGSPNWYAPKWLALWGMVPFLLAVRLLIWLASTYTPQLVHGEQIGIAGMSITVVAAHFLVLRTAATTR